MLLCLVKELDPSTIAQVTKELSSLEKLQEASMKYRKCQADLHDLQTIIDESNGNDEEVKELRELAIEEKQDLEQSLTVLYERILALLIPVDEADHRSVVLEVRAGAGGEEAALFAKEIFGMYERYATKRGWKFATLEVSERESSANISGNSYGGIDEEENNSTISSGVYGSLKFESGVHRVQRVPETEAAGRVHTSTVSVAVLPEATHVDVEIKDSDLRLETMRASGAGTVRY